MRGRPLENLLLLGGSSDIGGEVAWRLAQGRRIILAARDLGRLDTAEDRMRVAGAADVVRVFLDADDLSSHVRLIDDLESRFGPVDIAVVAVGILGDQQRAEEDPAHAAAIIHTDFTVQVSLLTALSARMRDRGRGQLVAFGSIAGSRVRRANYVYGSAKAGLAGFVQGMQDALHGSGVHLLLVRPGFVIGRMTAGMTPAPMSSTPGQVAQATVNALQAGHASVWVPGSLRLLAAVMSLVPRPVWRRMPR